MTDVLAKICADKRQHISDRKAVRPFSEMRAAAEARNRTDPPRGFRARLERVVRAGRFGADRGDQARLALQGPDPRRLRSAVPRPRL